MPGLDAIANAGGWAIAVFMALSIIVAIIGGRLVTGPVHAREIARGDRLEAEAVRLVRRATRYERGLARCRSALAAAKRRTPRVSA